MVSDQAKGRVMTDRPHKGGRPVTTGAGYGTGVKLDATTLKLLDLWRAAHGGASRPVAVAQLVRMASTESEGQKQ
ncbi:hypothetical protein CCP1ISM_670004 [Azospirillaceae bacterium]